MSTRTLLAIAFAAVFWGNAQAQDLVIGVAAPATSIDPHFYDHDPSNAVNRHVYDTLVAVTPAHGLAPALAESWSSIDPLTWEFKLRKGVRFHDGSPFTSEDVRFSLTRAKDVPNSPGSFAYLVRPIAGIEVVDESTIRLKTAQPFPILPNYMSAVFMVSRKHGEGASTADYNSGKAAVGTGPYRLERHTPNSDLLLKANDAYWGGKPAWAAVTIKVLSNPATRVAAMLSGDVDVIEAVPSQDIARLKGDARIKVSEGMSARTMFMDLDFRDQTPMITGADGAPIKNPLVDRRVREAMSLAINREAMVARVMEGQAVVANQIVPRGVHGFNPSLPPAPFDLARGQALLKEAGYPKGFKMVIHGPNDRYPNDRSQLEALAQMWGRLGLDVTVDVMPSSVYFTRASKQEFSAFLIGYGAGTTGAVSTYRANLMTFDSEKGNGSNNRGRYSNPAFDALMNKALSTLDVAERDRILQDAGKLATEDYAVLPMFYLANSWATKKGITFEPRVDGFTTAMSVRRD